MFAYIIYNNPFQLSAHLDYDICKQIMSHRPGQFNTFQSPVNSQDFRHAYDDWKAPVAEFFGKNNYLLISSFVNQYT